MKRTRLTLRFLLVTSALAFCLSACGGSDSSPSAAASSTAKSASWTNVSIRSLDGKININWDRATGSAFGTVQPTYNIYRSIFQNMQDGERIAENYSGTSFDYTDLSNGERYYYTVTEVTAAGEGPASRAVSAAPEATRPAAPYGLKVTALDASAKLELAGAAPATSATMSYNLYRSTSRDFTADVTKTAMAAFTTPYSDTNLANGTTYYYAVTAVVSGKESGYSPVVAARPQAKIAAVDNTSLLNQLAAFASPTDMSAEPGNGSCDIKWLDVADLAISGSDTASTAPYYILYWSDSPDVIANKTGQIDDASKDLTVGANGVFTYKLTRLNNGAMYYLQLAAAVKDADGVPKEGRFTTGPVVAITPALKTPATPGGVGATQGSQQVALTWSKDTSGVTYNIYFSTTSPGSPADLMKNGTRRNNDDPTKAYYTHSGLQTGKTYYYVVTAVDEGESAPSSIVAVTL